MCESTVKKVFLKKFTNRLQSDNFLVFKAATNRLAFLNYISYVDMISPKGFQSTFIYSDPAISEVRHPDKKSRESICILFVFTL